MNKKKLKIANRSGKKKCPICCRPEILVEHHIEGRDIKNPNHPSNLAYICDNCHRKVHMGLIVLEGWYQTTVGKELFWHEAEKESFTGNDAKPHIIG